MTCQRLARPHERGGQAQQRPLARQHRAVRGTSDVESTLPPLRGRGIRPVPLGPLRSLPACLLGGRGIGERPTLDEVVGSLEDIDRPGARHLRMETAALHDGQLREQGLANHCVREGNRRAVGDEQPRCQEVVQGIGCGGELGVRGAQEQVEVHAFTEDGAQAEQGQCVVPKWHQAAPDDITDAAGQRRGVTASVVQPCELDGEERVAPRPGTDTCELVCRHPDAGGGDQGRRRGAVERPEGEVTEAGRPGEVSARPHLLVGQVLRPGGDQEGDGCPVELASEEAQQPQRGGVGPVGVLQDDDDRRGGGRAHHGVAHPLEDAREIIRLGRGVARTQGRAHLSPGPQRRDAGILVTPTPRGEETATLGEIRCLLRQPGLADARLTLDDDVPRSAGPQLRDGVEDDLPLSVAPDQRSSSGRTSRPRSRVARTRRGLGRHRHRAGMRPAAQDRQVQLTQLRPRLEAEVLVEQVANSSVSLESVGRAAAAVQRFDEQQPTALPKRMRGRQDIEVRDGVLRSADRHEGLETVLLTTDPQLAPPLTGDPRDLAVLQLREWVTGAPQRQCVLGRCHRGSRASRTKLAPTPGCPHDETGHVDLVVTKNEPVAVARTRHDRAAVTAAQDPSGPGDVGLQRAEG